MDKLEEKITKLIKKKLKAKKTKSKSKKSKSKSKVKKTKDISEQKFDKEAIIKAITSAVGSGSKTFTPMDTSVKTAPPALISAGLSIPEQQKETEMRQYKEALDRIQKANKKREKELQKQIDNQIDLTKRLETDFKKNEDIAKTKIIKLEQELENVKEEEEQKLQAIINEKKRRKTHGPKFKIETVKKKGGAREIISDIPGIESTNISQQDIEELETNAEAMRQSELEKIRESRLKSIEQQKRIQIEEQLQEQLKNLEENIKQQLFGFLPFKNEHQAQQELKGRDQQTLTFDSDRQLQTQLNTNRKSSEPSGFLTGLLGPSNPSKAFIFTTQENQDDELTSL